MTYKPEKGGDQMTTDELIASWDDGGVDAETVAKALLADAGLPNDDDAVRVALAVEFSGVLRRMI